MPAASDVILSLPLLRWRGLPAHCESAPLHGQHDQAERRVPYRDGAGHDHTGRAPYTTQVRLWFVETIGSYGDLPAWLEAVEDGSSGELLHPLRGKFQARVLTWDIDLNASNRGGVPMDVTFTETVDDYDDIKALGTLDISPSDVAEAAEQACDALGIEYPDGQNETSITEGLDAIEGGITSAGLSVGGKINQVSGAINSMISTVEDLDDPMAWPALDSLMLLQSTLADLGRKAEKLAPRPTATKRTQNDTTIDAIASSVGNTTAEIMGLNLALLRSPTVPKGSTFTYYKS